MIRITSKRDGFRRCGVAHPAKPTEHPNDKFSKKELVKLKADSMLIVDEIPDREEDSNNSKLEPAVEPAVEISVVDACPGKEKTKSKKG